MIRTIYHEYAETYRRQVHGTNITESFPQWLKMMGRSYRVHYSTIMKNRHEYLTIIFNNISHKKYTSDLYDYRRIKNAHPQSTLYQNSRIPRTTSPTPTPSIFPAGRSSFCQSWLAFYTRGHKNGPGVEGVVFPNKNGRNGRTFPAGWYLNIMLTPRQKGGPALYGLRTCFLKTF